MRADLSDRLEAMARTVNPAPSMISDDDDSRVKLPPDDMRALLREAAIALRALRDAPVCRLYLREAAFHGAPELAGQRVRLVVVEPSS